MLINIVFNCRADTNPYSCPHRSLSAATQDAKAKALALGCSILIHNTNLETRVGRCQRIALFARIEEISAFVTTNKPSFLASTTPVAVVDQAGFCFDMSSRVRAGIIEA